MIARSETVARRSRSKPGDSSLCSEQAPQFLKNKIAAPFGLALTRKEFNVFALVRTSELMV